MDLSILSICMTFMVKVVHYTSHSLYMVGHGDLSITWDFREMFKTTWSGSYIIRELTLERAT